MRIGIFACALLWAGFTTGKLYSAPKVSMSAKLQETLAGRVVQRHMEAYVGKSFTFIARGSDAARQRFSGVIEQVIVPDIAGYLSTGDHSKARFKAKLRDVQPQEPQDSNIPLPEVVDLKQMDIFHTRGAGFVGQMQLLSSETLGHSYRYARLLAKYQDDGGETLWEALVEIDTKDHKKKEIAPLVVLLSEKEDFMEIVAFPAAN